MAKNKQNAQSTDPVINDILKRLEFVESRVGISPGVQESAPDATAAAPEDTALAGGAHRPEGCSVRRRRQRSDKRERPDRVANTGKVFG